MRAAKIRVKQNESTTKKKYAKVRNYETKVFVL